MNPSIEAAWIAGSSGFLGVLVGVTGTAVVARLGFKSTRAATDATVAGGVASVQDQIEADRRTRIWEKQAAAYTDAFAGIRHRQKVRQVLMQGIITGTEPERPPVPVDWVQLEAQLLAYASPEVIEELKAAGTAGAKYESEVRLWHTYVEQARHVPVITLPVGSRPAAAREAAEKALAEANLLDDRLMDRIRAELHAGTDQVPAPPVPLAPPTPDAG